MRWFGGLLAALVALALIGGVAAVAYNAGLDHNTTAEVVTAGAQGGTVIVRDGRHYGGGGFFAFFPLFGFFFFLLLMVLLFKALAFGFGRGGPRGWGGDGYAAFEERARRRHGDWHRSETPGTEPPFTPASTQ